MKSLKIRAPKKALIALAVLAATVGFASAAHAFYPNRPTFTMNSPAPYVTFDSITDNNDYGDERSFLDAKNSTNTASGGYADKVQVTDGEVLTLRMYVHNDAASNLNGANLDGKGVAKGVSARVYIPTATDTSLRANGYIDATNANPGEVSDTVDFAGSTPFSLEYVPGSATQITNAVPGGFKLNDSIVTTGAPLGYTSPNGVIPGCLQYSSYVTVQVKVKAANFTFAKKVALPGQAWTNSVNTTPGSTVSYELAFDNNGSQTLNNVDLRDKLPTGMSIVPNSSVLYNQSHPSGVNLGTDAVVSTNGVNIGDYAPTANAFLTFKATVPSADKLTCGDNTLTNTGEAWVGSTYQSGTANVVVTKACTPTTPTPTYTCDLFGITQGDNRTVTVNQFATTQTNGAAFSNVVIDWGDKSTPLTTNTAVGQKHQYAADGTYTINAVAHFTVNGKDVTATGANCSKTVTFTTPATPATPTTPTTATPTALVNTGAGSTLGIFAAAMAVGTVAYRLFIGRRLSRNS